MMRLRRARQRARLEAGTGVAWLHRGPHTGFSPQADFRIPHRGFLFALGELALQIHHGFVQSQHKEKGDIPSRFDIANFQSVHNRLDVGGQPTDRGFQWLARNGFTTIITLRSEDREHLESKRWPCFKHHAIPLLDRGVPSFADVEKFLAILSDTENGKIFVHCRGGTGRARTMAACWQIANGASAESAIQQAHVRGVRWKWTFFFNASVTMTFSINLEQEAFLRSFETYWRHKQDATVAQVPWQTKTGLLTRAAV